MLSTVCGQIRRILALAGFGLMGIAGQASGSDRIALVIGNSDYEFVTPLANPVNDAADIRSALETLGFGVFVGTNLSRVETFELIEKFGEAREVADAALFYFAGHAFQVGGRNYLIPSDLSPEEPEEVLGIR